MDAYRAGLVVEHGDRPNVPSHSMTADLPAVRANHGVLGRFSVSPTMIHASPDLKPSSPGAEHFSPKAGSPPVRTRFSPNELEYAVDGREGLLAVNKNFDSNWTASSNG